MTSHLAGLRVLKVVPTILSPPKKSSGMKTYTLTLRGYLEEKGLKVDVLGGALDDSPQKSVFLVRIPRKSDVLFSLYVIPEYMKLKDNYDLIHVSDPFLTLPLLLYFTKKPSVITLHELWSDAVRYKRGFFAGAVARLVEYFSLKLASKLIVVNYKIKDAYVRKYPWAFKKIETVAIGVDLDSFKPTEKKVRDRFGFAAGDKIILYLGRLEKEKNLPFLLQAFAHVKKKEKEAKLVLVGGGKEKRHLESLTSELKLRDVIFLDALAQESVPLILNCADVFALTSQYESSPLVAQEALACGVPIVSVDVGRVREFVSSELAGEIVPRNPEAMADALVSFLGKNKKMVKASCVRSVRDFGFENTVKETLDVYGKTLASFPR